MQNNNDNHQTVPATQADAVAVQDHGLARRSGLRRRLTYLFVFLIFVCILAGVLVQAIWRPFADHGPIQTPAVKLDLLHPDAIIDTPALSRLPADMLRVPLLRDVLTQDFVDYYQANPERLSVDGTLRRLAFEHDLDLSDALISRVFDEPAHVLLWRSSDGRLGYWAMSMHRNGLARLLQGLANVAASDSQLRRVASIGDTPVYALKLAVGHTLLFAARDDRLLVLSSPGILLDNTGVPLRDRARAFDKMLDDGRDASLSAYQLDDTSDTPKGHRVVVSANYLSFGYQAFFSGIQAFRFDFSTGGQGASDWHTSVLLAPARLTDHWNNDSLWHSVPANAAACASLPTDWRDADTLLGHLLPQDVSATIGAQLTGPIGVCWYAQSRLVSPLFAVRVKPMDAAERLAFTQALSKAFDQVVGAYEAHASQAKTAGDDAYLRLPVQTRTPVSNATVWLRPVSADMGTALTKGSPYADQLSESHYFPVTLAFENGYLLFSPDARLVDNARAVLEKSYPAMADTFPDRAANTILTLTPASAATLVQDEAGSALPADQETILRNAARAHLLPKLKALAAYRPITLSLPDTLPSETGWVPVVWRYGQAPTTPPFPMAPKTGSASGVE